nr:hypothetical protein [Tanacetum cinerariifolium]
CRGCRLVRALTVLVSDLVADGGDGGDGDDDVGSVEMRVGRGGVV